MRTELELFAHNLNLYMEKYGYNQTTLGKAVGNAPSTVAEWVHGRKFPRIDTVDKLTELFHCKRSDLLETYTMKEDMIEVEQLERLMSYFTKLNAVGVEKTIQYMEDLAPRYFKGKENEKA